MTDYRIGKTVFGNEAAIRASYERFRDQPIDETRLATTRACPFGPTRFTLASEAKVTDVGTFDGRENQTIAFAPSKKPGWWIRRMDQPDQLDTKVDIARQNGDSPRRRCACVHKFAHKIHTIFTLLL